MIFLNKNVIIYIENKNERKVYIVMNNLTVKIRIIAPLISLFLIWNENALAIPLWAKIILTIFFIYDAIDIKSNKDII